MVTSTMEQSTCEALAGMATIDDIEQELIRLEGFVSTVRARQCELLGEIDRLQIPGWDGTRSLKEWIGGRLDVHPRTASDLDVLTKNEHGPTRDGLAAGVWSVDRAAALARLVNAGVDQATLERAEGLPITQVGRLRARYRRMAPIAHHEAFRIRRLSVQPNLDNTLAMGSFTMSGADADALLEALDARADELVSEADRNRPRLEQRRVDALVSFALDAHDGGLGEATAPRRLRAHIFVDAHAATASRGDAGAATRSGLKVGANTLEEILCAGESQTTIVDGNRLVAVRTDGDRLPQRARDYVFHRDGGCTADGCISRYRLEPHHITPRSAGGTHDPTNLTLLCWFHHHVVVHQMGYRIHPRSPHGRRRFVPPDVRSDPPTR